MRIVIEIDDEDFIVRVGLFHHFQRSRGDPGSLAGHAAAVVHDDTHRDGDVLAAKQPKLLLHAVFQNLECRLGDVGEQLSALIHNAGVKKHQPRIGTVERNIILRGWRRLCKSQAGQQYKPNIAPDMERAQHLFKSIRTGLTGLSQGQRGIGHRFSFDSRKRRIGVGFAAGGGEDVLDLDSARGQGVGDQRTVTSPGDRFRAHNHRRTGGGQSNELGQAVSKRGGLHVIGVAAKTRVLPTGIDGIFARVPEPSESGQMDIADSVLFQRWTELVLAELRIPERLRDRADVDELLYDVRLQRFEKLLDGQRGVADGEDRQGFPTARRYESIAVNSGSLYPLMTEEWRHVLLSRV